MMNLTNSSKEQTKSGYHMHHAIWAVGATFFTIALVGASTLWLNAELQTQGLPDPDLLIRTSGEVRLSNFLLWQAAYAELLFLDILWPDFDEEAFGQALEQFAGRQRRYGGRG